MVKNVVRPKRSVESLKGGCQVAELCFSGYPGTLYQGVNEHLLDYFFILVHSQRWFRKRIPSHKYPRKSLKYVSETTETSPQVKQHHVIILFYFNYSLFFKSSVSLAFFNHW